MNKSYHVIFLLTVVLAAISASGKNPVDLNKKQNVSGPRQIEENFQPKDKSQGYHYLLYNPSLKAKKKDVKWPLLVFLHGRGERGNNLNLVKKHGPAKIVEHKDLPFIIASPQCPRTDLWWNPKIVAGLVDELLQKHPIDPTKVYLTGLSQGGFGTWATAAEYPEKFAAIAPVCGGGKVQWAKKYGSLPIWNFHGDADNVVPVRLSRGMVEAIRKAGGKIKHTEYPGVGHDSWTKTYRDPKLYEWFLSHSKLIQALEDFKKNN
jgi:predicted peptidase